MRLTTASTLCGQLLLPPTHSSASCQSCMQPWWLVVLPLGSRDCSRVAASAMFSSDCQSCSHESSCCGIKLKIKLCWAGRAQLCSSPVLEACRSCQPTQQGTV